MSDFIDSQLNPDTGIDFSKAQKLPGGGSTCDIYKAISQRRKVFVKRLKPKFRNMPVYLSAFDKEYDIGISLNHKSLPQYREFHGDYIVMDFIDGKTLADMIKEKDPWLEKEKNVMRILRELIEVVDYLHQHNVVHCDIKPDNIMITNGNRNLILIDLDKCYTDWLDDTSGDPSRYEVSIKKIGDKSIDFHGINLLVNTLMKVYPQVKTKQLLKFKEACLKAAITIDDLKYILQQSEISTIATYNKSNKLWLILLPLIMLAFIGIFLWYTGKKYDEKFLVKSSPPEKDTVVVMHQRDKYVQDIDKTYERPVTIPNNENKTSEDRIDTVDSQQEEISAADITIWIEKFEEQTGYNATSLYLKNKISGVSSIEIDPENNSDEFYISEIEKELPDLLAPVNEWLNLTEKFINDSTFSSADLKEIRFMTQMDYNDLVIDVANYFKKKFSMGNPVKIEMAVVKSPLYKNMNEKYRNLKEIMKIKTRNKE